MSAGPSAAGAVPQSERVRNDDDSNANVNNTS